MTSERGSYRGITRVLLDGQDFQKLSPIGRSVFLNLKVDFGPAGIEVHYGEALLWQLTHQTGWTMAECAAAMDELEAADWIRREQNVVWIVKQLRYEPSLTSKNPKHRKMIEAHVAGLPTLGIVKAFVTLYREWFDDVDTVLKRYPKGIDRVSGHEKKNGNGIERVSNHRRQKTETEDRRQKTDIPPADADGHPPAGVPASWTARLASVWSNAVGEVSPGRVGATLKRAVDRHGVERVERAMRAYAAVQKGDGKTPNLKWFADQTQVWIDRTTQPADVIDGEMSDTLELLTRPSSNGVRHG